MNKTVWIIVAAGIFVLLLGIAAIVWGGEKTPAAAVDPAKAALAACLAEKQITMYGTKTCAWCKKQKEEFGAAFTVVPYVECSIETQKCLDQKITATPTWIWPDGKRVESYLSLPNLAKESGCPYPNQ